MKWWTDIRRKVLVEHVSKRKVMAEYSIHAKTLEKIGTAAGIERKQIAAIVKSAR